MEWPRIFDPKFPVDIIPRCESINYFGEGEFTGIIRLRSAGIKGSCNTCMLIVEPDPTRKCR